KCLVTLVQPFHHADNSLPDLLGRQPLQSALAPQQANGEFAVVTSTVQLLLQPFRVKRVRLAAPSSLVIQAFVRLPPVQLAATYYHGLLPSPLFGNSDLQRE